MSEVNEESKKKWEQLKWNVNALNELLKDEQPGLMSWCQMYAERMKFISDYWTNN